VFDGIVDILLVGDSLNMTFAGKSDTLSATLEQMIYHTKAVCNGAKSSFIVCDMPFGTYNDKQSALENATKVYKETLADAVKIEGGVEKIEIIKYLIQNSIAVMGHIGLKPQVSRSEGGYKVKGKTEDEINSLVQDAIKLEEAGVFAIVLEGVKSQATQAIKKAVNIPIIGIGAGKECDGQVLVWSDMLGINFGFKPKFVREYLNTKELIQNAVKEFVADVNNGNFPGEKESY
jgi:3-methyl-2-oxobutanoate hydroxymethyltransferase